MKTNIKIENCPNPQVIVIHTDFNIQNHPSLGLLIEQIDGVESSMTFGVNKYSFNVEFGKAFDRDKITQAVKKKIQEYVEL